MVGGRLAGIRITRWQITRWQITRWQITRWTVFCLGLFTCVVPHAASAADCPGHPDALGTSRTLVVDPREHPRIGAMQYPETLPLRDHEVVLTFDDGPLPRNSNQVLQILADQCIKATFFVIGQQALANPEGVRKYIAAGHSIGSHSQHHPLTFSKMSAEQAKQEIDAGIASVTAALSDPAQLAPFFRIPGLLRAEPVEEYVASQGIQLWSADFLADDWHHISSSRVYDLAIKRIEARGKGVLLLHDIQARTVAALPRILQELKARGYHIVHVVPATPQRPATPTEPEQWLTHPSSAAIAALHWPKIPSFVFAEAPTMPAPALSDFDSPDGALLLSAEPFDRAKQHGVPTPREAPWPSVAALPMGNAVAVLPAPGASLFTLPYKAAALMQPSPAPSHHAEQAVPGAQETGGEAKPAAPHPIKASSADRIAKVDHKTAGARTRVGHGAHRTRHAAHGARRSVRIASLKKR
jgi:peptidoglycan-N-acetylglucosamine deacetylase